jgi:enolase
MLNVRLYEFIAHACNFDSVSIPYPMFNLINGGKHADNNLPIQEIMLVPMGFNTFKEAIEAAVVVQNRLQQILHEKGKRRYVGDEGGFCADFANEQEALDLLLLAIEKAGYTSGEQFKIALDVAASQLYDQATGLYNWGAKQMNTQSLIEYYVALTTEYPIYSIEDGLEEDDWTGWTKLTETLGEKIQIVGDDLFVTTPERIASGIEQQAATAAIIKPNQIGTVTETLQAILLCKDNNINTVVSHRSGETEDTFIVDLAVGANAGQLKAGGCQRGERMAKYNQLLRIEDALHRSIMDL